MIEQILEKFGFARELSEAGWFENDSFTDLLQTLKEQIRKGRIVVVTGAMGVGKTSTIEQIRPRLEQEKDILISISYSVEKQRINLQSLISALTMDLSFDDPRSVGKSRQPEYRERLLRRLFSEARKNVALFIDEAHDLPFQTLVELKRMMETCKTDTSKLSIVLVGHPRLKDDLRKPELQEIGNRSYFQEMRGIAGSERAFFNWLMEKCLKDGVKVSDVFTDEAVEFIVQNLTTPLQMHFFIWRALEEAFEAGQKHVSIETLRETVARDLQDKESRLVRLGYNARRLADILRVREGDVRFYFAGKLAPEKHKEIDEGIQNLGLIAARS